LSEGFVDWFRKTRKLRAIRMIVDQSELAMKCVDSLEQAIRAVVETDVRNAEKFLEFVKIYEKEADSVRRRIMEELAKGELPSAIRGDLMRLARQIDLIADWSRIAGRLIRILLADLPKIFNNYEELRNGVLNMMRKVRGTSSTLNEAIKDFYDKRVKLAFEKADEVERLEREIDDLYEKVRMTYVRVNNMKVGGTILLGQLLDAIENIADRCEDSCDQLRVVLISVI